MRTKPVSIEEEVECMGEGFRLHSDVSASLCGCFPQEQKFLCETRCSVIIFPEQKTMKERLPFGGQLDGRESLTVNARSS